MDNPMPILSLLRTFMVRIPLTTLYQHIYTHTHIHNKPTTKHDPLKLFLYYYYVPTHTQIHLTMSKVTPKVLLSVYHKGKEGNRKERNRERSRKVD